MSLQTSGIGLMLCSTLFFSIMGALAKFASSRLPAMEVVFFRTAINALLVGTFIIATKKSLFGHRRDLLFTRSLFGFCAVSCSFYALSRLKLADASILNHTSAIFVALLSILILREKVTKLLFSAILIALSGAVLIIKPSDQILNSAGLVGLLGGFMSALAYVTIKRLHASESSLTIVFNFGFYSSLGSLVLYGQNFIHPSPTELMALIGVGVLGSLGQVCMTHSYKFAPASVVSPYSYAGVIFSAIWGSLFWSELPDIWSIFGAALIVGAGITILRIKKADELTPSS